MRLGRRPPSAKRVRLAQSSRCFSKAADEGDVVRPSAQASVPVSPPAVADQHAGNSNSSPASSQRSSSSSNSTSDGNNSSKGSSYSEFYKVVNSRQYGPTSAAGGHFALAGGTSLDTSSSSSDPSTHHHSQQEQSHQQPVADAQQAAAVRGDGHHVGSEAQLHLQQPAGSTDPAGVEDAIRKAQEALAAAETSLSSIHKLRSAQPPSKWSGLLQVLKSLATAAAAGALLVASHAFGLGWQWAGATIGALALAGMCWLEGVRVSPALPAAAWVCRPLSLQLKLPWPGHRHSTGLSAVNLTPPGCVCVCIDTLVAVQYHPASQGKSRKWCVLPRFLVLALQRQPSSSRTSQRQAQLRLPRHAWPPLDAACALGWCCWRSHIAAASCGSSRRRVRCRTSALSAPPWWCSSSSSSRGTGLRWVAGVVLGGEREWFWAHLQHRCTTWGLGFGRRQAAGGAGACLLRTPAAGQQLLVSALLFLCFRAGQGARGRSRASLTLSCAGLPSQVAGVAAIPTILAIAYGAMAGCLDLPLGSLPNVETWRADLLTLLQGAVLGWYACICGDAWSGELGELSGRVGAALGCRWGWQSVLEVCAGPQCCCAACIGGLQLHVKHWWSSPTQGRVFAVAASSSQCVSAHALSSVSTTSNAQTKR